MIFPIDENELENEYLDDEDQEVKEYEIDFVTGQLTGRVVEGLKAILMWAWMALQTTRYRYYIYSWDYGQEIEEYIGKGYTDEHLSLEMLRILEECLMVNEHITEIQNYEFYRNEKGEVMISFSIITDYGEEKINVRGNDFRIYNAANDE